MQECRSNLKKKDGMKFNSVFVVLKRQDKQVCSVSDTKSRPYLQCVFVKNVIDSAISHSGVDSLIKSQAPGKLS